jgi:hypothetical protein
MSYKVNYSEGDFIIEFQSSVQYTDEELKIIFDKILSPYKNALAIPKKIIEEKTKPIEFAFPVRTIRDYLTFLNADNIPLNALKENIGEGEIYEIIKNRRFKIINLKVEV